MANEGDEFTLPTTWVGVEDHTIVFANQFMVQFSQNEFVITMGQITPPVLLGSMEQRREQAKNIPFLPIKTVGRFAMTRGRLQELTNVLQQMAERYDKESEKK